MTSLSFCLSLLLILLISIALYACYEAPARKRLRGLWRHQTSPDAVGLRRGEPLTS